jgi:hypothetical protein
MQSPTMFLLHLPLLSIVQRQVHIDTRQLDAVQNALDGMSLIPVNASRRQFFPCLPSIFVGVIGEAVEAH